MEQSTHFGVQAQLASIKKTIKNQGTLPFKDFISSGHLQLELLKHFPNYRERIYSPVTTLLAFLAQVLCADQSCQQAVACINSERIVHGLEPASSDTGAYCKARSRLPEEFLHALVKKSGDELESHSPVEWLWKGRHVKLVDGSTLSMPDTSENQAEYPQQKNQKPGLGFPLARIVAILSLATGAVIDLAVGPYQGKFSGEHSLLRTLLNCLNPGDVVLADAYYCSFFLIATLNRMGIDIVCRIHGARKRDFRRGKRLGTGDHIVIYERPKRPSWMNEETYRSFPETIEVRESKVTIERSGFRTYSLVVVSTLTDVGTTSKADLAELYLRRWNAELDLRNIKITMQMEILNCKSPAMARKEIWAYLLAYNMIRKIIANSALKHRINPRSISFKGSIQILNAYRCAWIYNSVLSGPDVYQQILDAIAQLKIMNRPNRVEPRAEKRRPRQQPMLMVPRETARQRILQGAHP